MITSPASVQYGGTFLVVGGRSNDDLYASVLKTIYAFRTLANGTEVWEEQPSRLAVGRDEAAAFVVDPDDFPDCPDSEEQI